MPKSTQELKTRVETGFDTLFETMTANQKTLWKVIATTQNAIEKMNYEIQRYEKETTTRNLGFFEKKSVKKEHKTEIKNILSDTIDELVDLGTWEQGGQRSQEQMQSINSLKKSLRSMVDKTGGVELAKGEFSSGIKSHTPEMNRSIKRVNDLIQTLRDNIPKIAKLAPKGKEMGLTSPYYQEYLFDLHFPVATGTGTELLSAMEITLSTGEPPVHFKILQSGNENESLYDTMIRAMKTTNGDKAEFFRTMKEEFLNSPDIPNEMVEKNFKSVTYLSPEEREAYTLNIRDGRLYMGDSDIPYDTTELESKGHKGQVAYVITPEGKIMASPHVGGEFHHSSFLAGARVIAAGTMVVEDGKIVLMTNNSGHYKPQEHNIVEGINSVPDIDTVFHETGKVLVDYSPTQKGPESLDEFMQRAEPLAQERWNQILQEQEEYKQKLHDSIRPMLEESLLSSENSDIELQSIEKENKGSKIVRLKDEKPYKSTGKDYFKNISNDDTSIEMDSNSEILLVSEPTGFGRKANEAGKQAVSRMFDLAQENPIDLKAFQKEGMKALRNGVENFKTITLDGKTLRETLEESISSNVGEAMDILKMKKTMVESKSLLKDKDLTGIKVDDQSTSHKPSPQQNTNEKSQGIR